jgi:hypothetical protein
MINDMNKKPSKYDQIISNVDPDLLLKWKKYDYILFTK